MLNSRQFLISDTIFSDKDWLNIKLSTGKILNYQKDLPVFSNKNNSVVLLGDAWQVLPDKPSPEEQIALCNGSFDEIIEIEKTWCGRYCIIAQDLIYLDTCGLLGVFYSENNLSSSLNVLCQVEKRKVLQPKIFRGVMPDFVPGMDTEYDGISRLLPSQVYNYLGKKLIYRKLLPDSIYTGLSDQERTSIFSSFFTTSLKNMKSHFNGYSVLIALTGGRDSRAALSLLQYSGIPFETFTLEHDSISDADKRIPPRVSNAVGKSHIYVKRQRKKFSSKRIKEFESHTAGQVVDQDKLFYGYGQYQELQESVSGPVVILRSGVWGIAIDYYSKYFKGKTITRDNICDFFQLLKYNTKYCSSVHKWFDWVENDSNNQDITIENRLYWEIRAGCWLSDIEQSFDLLDKVTSIQPLNCRLLLSCILGYDFELRKAKLHEEYIITYACEKLNNIPYDYQQTHIEKNDIIKKNKYKFKKGKWLLQTVGVKNTYDYFKHRN